MLLHVDSTKFKVKPTGKEIGRIKAGFTKSASIKELTAKEVADNLTAGKTVQPGVTPFSEESQKSGAKGTRDEDFKEQTLFMQDVDNKRADLPLETPAHVAAQLAEYDLKAAFMYESFSSTEELQRFRVAIVADEAITDRAERDRIQAALLAAFPQSDQSCMNADRIFFGTDKGLIDDYTDFAAVCKKDDLLAFADVYEYEIQNVVDPTASSKDVWTKFGESIPTGRRHGTLVGFAASVLTRFGICDDAYDLYIRRVEQCEEPMPDDEIAKIWEDACRYYEDKTSKAPGYIPPEQYATLEFSESVIPSDFTDVGQATLFADLYGDRVRYSDATRWIVYDGSVWHENEIMAQGCVQDLTNRQLEVVREQLRKAEDAEEAAVEAGDEEKTKAAKDEVTLAKKFRTFVLGERKTTRIAATLTEARPALQIAVNQLDRDPHLLNTPAGTIDLRTGEMRPHDPLDYCTKMTSVSPGTDGMDEFMMFLDRLTCHDKKLQDYLQEVGGMSIVGTVYDEKMITAYGAGGNGKSTLFNLEVHVLGDYAGMMSSDVLITNSRNNKMPEYAELRGKRLVIAAELEEGMRLDTSAVKKLCSTDMVRGEKKYKAPFDFMPSHTVVLYTNHLPKVGTIDRGTWDRLVVVPFNARFRGMKGEVLNYAETLYEHAGGAVLSWLIEGAKKFIAHGGNIKEPGCVKEACEKYREANDWLHNFLTDCCEEGLEYEVMSGELYQAYVNYCTTVREYVRGKSDLKCAMEDAGFIYQKSKKGMRIRGLRLKTPEFKECEEPAVLVEDPPFGEELPF